MWKKLRHWSVALLITTGVFYLLITFIPIDEWWANRLSGQWSRPDGDVLVVLAGGGGPGKTIGYGTYLRVEYALLAYQAHPFKEIIVSGAGSPVAQAQLMRQFLVCQGVPSEIIIAENTSTSTRENALNTQRLLGQNYGKVMLLTSDYHIYRAARVFRKIGIEVTPSPIPDVKKRSERLIERVPAFWELVQETGKIAYYKVRGWI